MIRNMQCVVAIGVALNLSAFSCVADEIPASWRKSMTDDPSTNWYLSEAMKPLPEKDAEILRIQKLAGVIGNLCTGAKFNKPVGEAFLKRSGYAQLIGEAYKEAAFLADDQFKFFDYRALAHLCAGSDYLFGSQGHLLPNMISGTKDYPRFAYDPSNPFIRLASIATARRDRFKSPIGTMPHPKISKPGGTTQVDALPKPTQP